MQTWILSSWADPEAWLVLSIMMVGQQVNLPQTEADAVAIHGSDILWGGIEAGKQGDAQNNPSPLD